MPEIISTRIDFRAAVRTGAPAVAIDIDDHDNGKHRRPTSACAKATRSCLSTHGAPFGQAFLTLLRWTFAVQFHAARRLVRSCMRSVDRVELSARLAGACHP